MAVILATILLSAPFGQAWAVHHADDSSVDLFVELTSRPSVAVAYVAGVGGFVESVPLVEVAPGVYGGNWRLPQTENYQVRFGAVFGDGSEVLSIEVSLVDLGVPLSVFVAEPAPTRAEESPQTSPRRWGWALVAVVAGVAALVAVTLLRDRETPVD